MGFLFKCSSSKCLISLTVALVFVVSYSIPRGFQNGVKISREKRLPGQNVTEETFQNDWFHLILVLLDRFSWLEASVLSYKSKIFRISSKN